MLSLIIPGILWKTNIAKIDSEAKSEHSKTLTGNSNDVGNH